MGIYKVLLKNIIYPILERVVLRTTTLKKLSFLNKTQYYSSIKLKKLQNRYLKKLIKHAYENVPYYKKIFNERGLTFKDIKNKSDLQKLPILTKDIIRKNFKDLTALNCDKFKPIDEQTTGGSTGVPLKFLRNRSSMCWIRASLYRSYQWLGFDFFSDKSVSLTGSNFDKKLLRDFKFKLYLFLMRQKILSTYNINEKMVIKYLKIIKKYNPKFIIGYPSSLEVFSRFIINNYKELNFKNLKGIISVSETLSPNQKYIIEKAFGVRVYNNYSSREFMIAQNCKKGNFHIAIENIIFETVKDNKQTVGKKGKVLITDLHNYVMPFIRYDNGDIAELTNKKCTCGINLPIMKQIYGRESELLVDDKGSLIPGSFMPHLVKNVLGSIREYQIIQEIKGELKVKIVKNNNFDKEDINYFISNLKKYFGNTKINLEYVKKIPRLKSGKKQAIISKIKRQI